MRTRTLHLALWLLTISFAITGTCQERPDVLMERLKNTEVSVRRDAARELAVNDPEGMGNQVLLLIEQALKDEDVQVRRLGSAAMNRVAWASAADPEYKSQHGITVDLENEPEPRDAILPILIQAANDSDAEVREGVILALFRAYPLTKGIERDLLKRFETEPSPKIRAVIVQYLAKHGSPAAEPLALRALDDADANVRGWAADALARVKALPEEALPKLVSLLESESSPFARQKFADAISSYGGQASEYLPQLRKSAVSETDETTKLKLEAAIKAVRNAAKQ